MNDDANHIKRFTSSSNMSMFMHYDDKVGIHGYISNSKSMAKGNSNYEHALSASEDGDGDDDDDDGYDFAPAA